MIESGTIMIVDDEVENVRLLCEYLEQAGYTVRPALSPETALRSLEFDLPDLILLDIRMPSMDGYEFCRSIKENPATRHIPVIFLSAMQYLEDKLEAFKAGGVDYLTKPFQEQEIIARVKTHLKLSRLEELRLEVAERQKAEEKLQASTLRHQAILQTAMDGFWLLDVDGRLLEVNETYCRMSGYSAEELLDGKITDLEAMETVEETAAHLKSLKMRGEGRFESRHRRKDGSLFDVEISAQYRSSAVDQFVVFICDITDRKRTEAALRQSEETYRALVDGLPDIVMRFDQEGRHLFVSERVREIVGIEPVRFIGKTHFELGFPEEQCRYWEKSIRQVFDNGTSSEAEFIYEGKAGPLFFNWRLIPERDVLGRVSSVLSISRDITERKKAELERDKLQAQLQQAQKLEAIGTLAGGIAHDFNNILGAVVGYSEIVRDDLPPDSPSIHDIDQVLKASHRAKDLVKQILAFSRQVETLKIPVQPAIIAKEAITLLRSSLPSTITITQDIDSEAGMVLADPTQIHQVVMNLATNAFHAMEAKGGTLSISLHHKVLSENELASEPDLQPGTYVQLSIRDTGAGILPEIRERIFDPFFTTKEVGKGTGLGLSMVYSIVKSCRGAIACDSRMGEGTEFRILLPALEGQNIPEENGSSDMVPRGKEQILFIDDEEMLVEMGKTMFERLGYQVTTRRNSLEALTTFQNQPDTFDLIITDQTMPGMTGIDLARRILQIRSQMPIILCTGYSSQISEEKAKAAGIKGFAYKPLAKKEIGELIRKVLDEKNYSLV